MALMNSHYFFTYIALVHRDILVIRQRLRGAMIDAGIQLLVQVITFGALFPTMGVPKNLIAPLFVGSIVLQLQFLGMGFGLRTIFDIKYNRFIDYRLTLPLPKRWLFASYITYFCIEAAIISLPLFTFGIILLGTNFEMIAPNWWLFCIIYLLTLCLYGLLFLGMSMYYSFDWFMQNLWPRRLTFLLMLSPLFVVWFKVKQFSPWFARAMLISPLTYATEGLRATLIGGPEYISAYICIPMLFGWIFLFSCFASYGIRKRLDPV